MSLINHQYKTLKEIRKAFERTKARMREIEAKANAKRKEK
tara:strand:+ start:227 stop:346 length:120 start_codon:yes stop_codon:yes gene_type:complete